MAKGLLTQYAIRLPAYGRRTHDVLFNEAKKYIPGGVNSPVRSFKAVGGSPVFMARGSGSRLYDENGKEYIDYCLSWGAMILGHGHPEVALALRKQIEKGTSFGTVTRLEIELAKLITEAMPSIEEVRLTSSGTEAVMSAIRVARGYTKKNKIIKFRGSYHGHADYLLAKAGSGLATFGVPSSLGVPKDFAKYTITLPFNDLDIVEKTVKKTKKDLAAIIVEPIQANCGVILPKEGYLESLREIADKYRVLLIFDEVITGFRLSYGGAEEYFGVKADLTCLGKIIGGGLPIGAFGGKRKIMDELSPEGAVYQAGTLSGNPVSVTCGITTLNILKRNNPYKALENKLKALCEFMIREAETNGRELNVNFISSMFSLAFRDRKDKDLFKKFYHGLLEGGIYFSPSTFETNFLSVSHTDRDIEKTKAAIGKAIMSLKKST